jgi:hypothetical protein
VRIAALGLLVGAGLAVYAASALVLGAVDLRQVRGLVLRGNRPTPLA